VIGLGLRLAVGGGREAITRLAILAAAAVSIGAGFAASALLTTVQLQHSLVPPDAAYYLLTGAGIVASLGIVAGTFPLLRRITGPGTARNE
jgi:hypothetical protein